MSREQLKSWGEKCKYANANMTHWYWRTYIFMGLTLSSRGWDTQGSPEL